MITPFPQLPQADLDHVFNGVNDAWLKLRGKSLFLTGGTGFVGKWLLATLLDANRRLQLDVSIMVLSRSPDAFRIAAPDIASSPEIRFIKGDVRDFIFPDNSVDVIVHGATDVVTSQTPLDIFDTCLSGTRRVLELARQTGTQSLLLISSGAVYGRQPADMERIPETYHGGPDVTVPSSAYGEGKRAAEWLASTFAAEYGTAVKIARCFAFIGPYLPLDKHFAIGNFIGDAIAGRSIHIQGDGTVLRSYLYAADMAAWLWAILLNGQSQMVYNVGADQPISTGDLANRVAQVLKSSSHVTIAGTPVPGKLPERYIPNIERAKSELGLDLAIPLDQAIQKTAHWYRSARKMA